MRRPSRLPLSRPLPKKDVQKLLGQANAGVPPFVPTDDDLNRMAAEHDEVYTEGRRRRPFPANPHD